MSSLHKIEIYRYTINEKCLNNVRSKQGVSTVCTSLFRFNLNILTHLSFLPCNSLLVTAWWLCWLTGLFSSPLCPKVPNSTHTPVSGLCWFLLSNIVHFEKILCKINHLGSAMLCTSHNISLNSIFFIHYHSNVCLECF